MPSAAFTAAVAAANSQFHANAQAVRDEQLGALELQREAEVALKKMQLGTEVDRAFLTLLYRLPTEAERTTWTDIVYSTGAHSVRTWAAQQAGLTAYELELRADSQANAQSVQLAFQIYLFRDPTAQEQSFWLEYANGTGSLNQLLLQLSTNSLASMRYGAGVGSQADTVTQAFNVLFGRAPSAAEKLAWTESAGHALPWLLAQAVLNSGTSTSDAVVMANRIAVAGEIRTLADNANTPVTDGSTTGDGTVGIGAATLETLVTQAIYSTGASTQSMTAALQVAANVINPPEPGPAASVDTTRPAEGSITRGDGLIAMTFSEPINWTALDSNGSGQLEFHELPVQLTGQNMTFGVQAQVLSATADRLVIGVGGDAKLSGASILLRGLSDMAGNRADLLFTAPADVGGGTALDVMPPAELSAVRQGGAVVLNFTESIQWSALDVNRNGRVEFSELPIIIMGEGHTFGTSPVVLSAQGARLVISVGSDASVDGPIFLSGVKDLAGNVADVLFL